MNTLEFCEKYLRNYTINHDNTIDVNDNVNLWYKLGNKISVITKIPVKFGKIFGWFDCGGNNLITLENCPNYVSGSFRCNILTHHILGNVQGDIHYNLKTRIVI
jgi:hypothetical protein